MCVCVLPKTLGQPGEVKISLIMLIMLKFVSLVDWMKIWENSFPFFGPLGPVSLGQPREVKNGPIMSKFGIGVFLGQLGPKEPLSRVLTNFILILF